MKINWARVIFLVLLFIVLSTIGIASCVTPRPYDRASAFSETAAHNVYRLKCECGAVGWITLEENPHLRVIVASKYAPLGIEMEPESHGIYVLRCSCGYIHLFRIVSDEDRLRVILFKSIPPPVYEFSKPSAVTA